jgi:hypothetical protein
MARTPAALVFLRRVPEGGVCDRFPVFSHDSHSRARQSGLHFWARTADPVVGETITTVQSG